MASGAELACSDDATVRFHLVRVSELSERGDCDDYECVCLVCVLLNERGICRCCVAEF